MAVIVSPIKIITDLGINPWEIENDEDYLRALKEATNTLIITNASDRRIPILQKEIQRVRADRKAADPNFKVKRTKINVGEFLGKKKKPKLLPGAATDDAEMLEGKDDGVANKKDNKKRVATGLVDTINIIAETVSRIETTLKEQKKIEDKNAKINKTRLENEKREKEESRLSKVTGFLKGAGEKILAPVQSIFGKLFKFIKTLILGKVFLNILKWFGNPANKGKINSIIKFFGSNWGKLLGLYLVFGTALGGFIRSITRIAIKGAVKLVALAAQLAAAKKIRGARGIYRATRGLKGARLAKGLQRTGAVGTALSMGMMFMKTGGDTGDDMTQLQSDMSNAKPGRELDPLVNASMNVMKQQYGITDTKPHAYTDENGVTRIRTQQEVDELNSSKLPFGMKMTEDGQNIDLGRAARDQVNYAAGIIAAAKDNPEYAEKLKEHGKKFGYDNLTPEQFAEISDQIGYDMQRDINKFIPGTESHRMDVAANEINQSTSKYKPNNKGVRFNQGGSADGGEVEGPGGVDKVPAMLTRGESVLQVGARERMVKTLGVDPLSFNVGPNANKPEVKDGMVHARRGLAGDGKKPMPINWEQGENDFKRNRSRGVKRYNLSKNLGVKEGQLEYINDQNRKLGLKLIELPFPIEKTNWKGETIPNPKFMKHKLPYMFKDFMNWYPPGTPHAEAVANSPFGLDGERKKGDGLNLKRMAGGFADFATLGMFDFDKKNRKGAPKDWGIRRMAGGLADFATMGLTDFDKRGAGILQFNPLFGGKDKAWGAADEQAKRGEDQSGFGLKRGIGGVLDFATGGMFDFDKQSGGGLLGKIGKSLFGKRGGDEVPVKQVETPPVESTTPTSPPPGASRSEKKEAETNIEQLEIPGDGLKSVNIKIASNQNVKPPVGQPSVSAPKVTLLPTKKTVNTNPNSGQPNSSKSIPKFSVGSGSSRKKKQLGIVI